jgi:hypothetical protein
LLKPNLGRAGLQDIKNACAGYSISNTLHRDLSIFLQLI